MRKQMLGMAAALVASVSAAPAMACGFNFGCGAPSYSYSNYSGCGQPVTCGQASYQRFEPAPQYYSAAPQYYYVDQGPTYTGPGMFAPAPSYQERAVSGWGGYSQPYYGYTGGPYANASHHYYDGMPDTQGPAVYSYRPRSSYYGYGVRRGLRYGYAPRPYRAPRYGYAPRYHRAMRHYGMPQRYAPQYRGPRHSMRYGYAPRQFSNRYAPRSYGARRFQSGPMRAY